MEGYPLYHPGVRIQLSPDGRAIHVASDNAQTAAEVQHEAQMHFGRCR